MDVEISRSYNYVNQFCLYSRSSLNASNIISFADFNETVPARNEAANMNKKELGVLEQIAIYNILKKNRKL